MAIEKTRAAEAVDREILHFPAVESDALKLYNHRKLARGVDSMVIQELPADTRTHIAMCARS